MNQQPRQPLRTIADLVREHARATPAKVALVVVDDQLDYGALDAMIDRIAASLQRDGRQPGDAVAICGDASLRYVALFLAIVRAGMVAVPFSPSLDAAAAAALFLDANAVLAFFDHAGPAGAIALRPSGGQDHFARWLAPEGSRPSPVPIEREHPFNIIYSSGTTGEPKGIVQPHAMREAQAARGPSLGFGPDSICLLSTPLYSNTTLVALLPTLAHGGTAVLMPKFDPLLYLELAERRRATHTMLVPVQYQRLLALPDFDAFDLSSLQVKLCTSAPLLPALKAQILARWPGRLFELYGMTEGGCACLLAAHAHPDKLHTVGRPSLGHDIRIIDAAGIELPPGESGEIVGHSPAVMMTGYRGKAAATLAAEWFDDTGRRFIRSGDIGCFDEDGFLILTDRKKDMLISGGFNIYPSDLEAALREHPQVSEAAVVGVPSERWGETPVGFVVLAEQAAASEPELLRWLNERVGKTQRLSALHLVAELPRSAIGKVQKRDLRDLHLRTAAPGA